MRGFLLLQQMVSLGVDAAADPGHDVVDLATQDGEDHDNYDCYQNEDKSILHEALALLLKNILHG